MTTTDQRCPSAFHYWHGSLVGEACNSCGASWKHDVQQVTPKPEARTWKDDIARELREKINACRFHLPQGVRAQLVDDLTPLVHEMIEHARTMERIGSGSLPYFGS